MRCKAAVPFGPRRLTGTGFDGHRNHQGTFIKRSFTNLVCLCTGLPGAVGDEAGHSECSQHRKTAHGGAGQYSGGCLNSIPAGQGILKYDNGSHYTGRYRDGQREGQGVHIMKQGTRCSGDWVNDASGRQGAHEWANGSSYCGGWKNGKKEGYGSFTRANGRKGFTGVARQPTRQVAGCTGTATPYGRAGLTVRGYE
jgi:hypothetical protein